MTHRVDRDKRFRALVELEPTTLAAALAGDNGQLAVVTDQAGRHLYVREGGSLVPAIEERLRAVTQSDIYMRVDGSGGTTPPAGTRVVNQDEYDALGYDLLSIQDALDIIPPGVAHLVYISVAAGRYPGNAPYFGYTASFVVPGFIDFGGYLYIQGESKTTIEVAQAGTVTDSKHIQRSAGTWTVDEHKGKLAEIKTGVGAGKVCPIAGNTADTLFVAQNLTTGACTFEINEPAAILEPGNAIGFSVSTTLFFYLDNLTFGDTTDPYQTILLYGSANLQGCSGYFAAYGWIYVYGTGLNSTMWYCSFEFTRGQINVLDTGSYLTIGATYIYGDPTETGTDIPGLLVIGEDSRVRTHYPIFEVTDGSATDPIIYSLGSYVNMRHNDTYIIGNGLCTGIYAEHGVTVFAQQATAELYIENCGTAVEAAKGAEIQLELLGTPSTSNVNGFVISGGARVTAVDPQNVTASGNELDLDSDTTATYSDLSVGDTITGPGGSSIRRTS